MASRQHAERGDFTAASLPLETRPANAAEPPLRARVGVNVLIGTRHERFWCLVKRVDEDGTIHAKIDNEPVTVHSQWRCGDVISFRAEHVFMVADESDRDAFLRLFAALGCEAEAAIAWRQSKGSELL